MNHPAELALHQYMEDAVSGKTNYLVSGEILEDNRPANESSKYKNAVSRSIPILTEKQFKLKIPELITNLED